MPSPATPQTMAAALVVAGGSGTAADVAVYRPEIAKFSIPILKKLIDKGAHVVACQGSVTDVATDLKGKVPRGWEGIKDAAGNQLTWDSVPGTYLSDGKRVLLATHEAAGGGRKMPGTGDGHGSVNVALHETLHGHDFLTSHKPLKDKRFIAARTGDFARLPEYLQQAGDAGKQETYAESGARFFAGDPALAADWPAMFAYWTGAPIPAPPPAHPPGFGLAARPAPAEPEGGAIGSAEMKADGSIHLDLRAEAKGAIGHAFVTLRPGDEGHARILAHAFPAPRGLGMAAAAPRARTVLLRPL
jgi:hypothetical protein